MITTYPSHSRSLMKSTTCQKTGENDCKESVNKQGKIPLNSSKVTRENIVENGTKVPVTNKKTSGITVTQKYELKMTKN